MNYLSLFIFPVVLLSCIRSNNFVIPAGSEALIDYTGVHHIDSLGYPWYYTHYDTDDISIIKNLMLNSDSITAFNFNKGMDNPANVSEEDCYLYDPKTNNLISGAYNQYTIVDQEEKEELISIVNDTMSYTGLWSGLAGVCFIPHVGIGFFTKGELTIQVSICFMCHAIRTRPFYKSDGLSEIGKIRLEKFITKIGLDVVY